MKFLLVARRDLAAYLSGMYGYLIIAILVLLMGAAYNFLALGGGAKYSAQVLRDFFLIGGVATGFAAWLMSMRAIAEEKQMRTELVLHTSPIAEWQIVLGKWLAVMGMVALFIALTAHMPAMIFVNGKVSLAQIGVGYLGMLLYGAAVSAVGVFASSIVRSQLLAAVISGAIVIFLVLLWLGSQVSEGGFAELAAYAAIWDKHYQPFQKGLVGLNHVVYYLSITWLFLMLATRSLQRRRWQ
jgi:ABC-2 type transport system permease protein